MKQSIDSTADAAASFPSKLETFSLLVALALEYPSAVCFESRPSPVYFVYSSRHDLLSWSRAFITSPLAGDICTVLSGFGGRDLPLDAPDGVFTSASASARR